MNIFVLDPVPEMAAQGHCDGDLVTGIRDLAVLLSTAHHLTDGTTGEDWYTPLEEPGPLGKWVGAHVANYTWAYALMVQLALEHEHRFGVEHLSWVHMGDVLENIPRGMPKTHKTMDFILKMPHVYHAEAQDGIITSSCATESYRRYYRAERLLAWTNRAVPIWCQT